MVHAHLICFSALSVYYIKYVYGHYIGGMPYPHLNDHCSKMPLMLNDCNWCKCTTIQYSCEVRNCKGNSDPFGKFNDAIQDISVGMEGHGFWRSYTTQCAANLQYQRGSLLCVCDARGEWPSAVCRDVFRILYPIEQFAKQLKPGDACSTNKLYLIGCNVCICPTDGQIDVRYCTNRVCSTLDESINVKDSNFNPRNYTVDEIYATCEKGVKLLVEDRECECYSGNRVICKDDSAEALGDNAEASVEIGENKQIEVLNKEKDLIATVVFVKPPYTGVCPTNEFVKVDCNYCFCMNDGNGICTTFKC